MGGIAAAVIALWVTFTPTFLMIFVAAPYIERLRATPWLAGALSAITAAVVGVILNLTVWFAAHVLFGRLHEVVVGPLRATLPDIGSANPAALLLSALAAVLLLVLRLGVGWTLLISAGFGLAVQAFG
jgi:chromate transporter